MPVSSFSASKLTSLISKLSESTIGLDTVRYDITPVVKKIIAQADSEAKRVLAYVLWTKCLSMCERFDGEPMSAEASQEIVRHLKGTLKEALQFLAGDVVNADKAMKLAAAVIAIDIRS